MKPNSFRKHLCVLIVFILPLILVSESLYAVPGTKLKEKFSVNPAAPDAGDAPDGGSGSAEEGESYSQVLKQYDELAFVQPEDIRIVLDREKLTAFSGTELPAYSDPEGRGDALLWKEDREYFEWTVDIPQDGLYEVEVEYCALEGSSVPVRRSVMIDGAVPFQEAYDIQLNRLWKDSEEPKVNNVGDEVRPRQSEERIWQTAVLGDSQGMYPDPFQFYLEKGAHRLRLIYAEEDMALGNIVVRSPERCPSYREVAEDYKKMGYPVAAQTVRFEAESSVKTKSDPTIRRESDSDPMTSPAADEGRRLNIIGGWRWRKGNQTIRWEFTVPEDGLYKIGLRVGQWFGDGLPVYRQIAVDGKVPFEELKEYKFEYNKKWRLDILGDADGEPYLFYLEKGSHVLSMTVKTALLGEIERLIFEDTLLLSGIIRQIIMLTGSTPDMNFEYELERNIPDLQANLTKLSINMEQRANSLSGLSSKRPAMANNFIMISRQLRAMAEDPDTIPLKLSDLNNALNSLGTWSLSLQDHPLAVDYFMVGNPEEEWTNRSSTFIQKLAATWRSFILSFIKDYDNIDSVYADQTQTNEVIDVWFSKGKEWAEIVKEMADEDFTPNTGIGIKINVIPASVFDDGSSNVLRLAISSGKAPDIACGVDAKSPVEFAIRDSIYDLSKFEDFKEISKRFLPQAFVPYQYNSGYFALPETMNFKVLFYQKDILEDLGAPVPDTWEDVYQHLLPVLYQHGLQFYYAPDFSPFLFQKGGAFYKDGGKTSALDSTEAYQAFSEYTELYSHYNIPVNASFFNRMRQGEIPIGVGDYGLYVQLSVAAPELAGRWGIAPLPGHRTESGEIDRSASVIVSDSKVGSVSTADIILNQSNKKDAGWEFLKWWTSDRIQKEFGGELEALMGVQARWNTANVNAFKDLPWNREHLKVIEKQWEWACEMPVVLGGYFTQRHISNAWNRVVLGETAVRDSLETAVKDINRELESKQIEYGFIDNSGREAAAN